MKCCPRGLPFAAKPSGIQGDFEPSPDLVPDSAFDLFPHQFFGLLPNPAFDLFFRLRFRPFHRSSFDLYPTRLLPCLRPDFGLVSDQAFNVVFRPGFQPLSDPSSTFIRPGFNLYPTRLQHLSDPNSTLSPTRFRPCFRPDFDLVSK